MTILKHVSKKRVSDNQGRQSDNQVIHQLFKSNCI